MESVRLRFGRGFRVRLGNRAAQAAEMVIAPGASEGGPSNSHRGADQWLFVVAGEGVVISPGTRRRLRPGTLLLIERGDVHEVRNTGASALRTLNFYCPPAYDHEGEPLARGKPRARKVYKRRAAR